jgi:hypothetical protein
MCYCGLASLTVPKGRSGRAKTKFFLHRTSINAPILSIYYFDFSVILSMYRCLFSLAYNGHVYETFGISKLFPVKLQLLLIRAEMFDNPLTAKCFIYDVVRSCFIYSSLFQSLYQICYPYMHSNLSL